METAMKRVICSCIVLFNVLGSIDIAAVDRLFTTAKERQTLDSRRYGRELAQGEESQSQTQSLHLNGVVTVDQKQPVIWLNGDSSENNDTELNPLSNRKNIELFLPERQLNVRLKPGQQLDLLTGRRLEAFNVPQVPADNSTKRSQSESIDNTELLADEPSAKP